MDQKIVNKEEIIENVKEFIINNFLFGDNSQAPKGDDSFMELGIIDSTGILEVINHIESQYSIAVNDDELVPENLDSLNNIAVFVLNKLK
ncbi:MAG: acyl carrier protein [Spirochaetales bacterium]|nr:acyl carrier protein [Spirochaetales bacterium]